MNDNQPPAGPADVTLPPFSVIRDTLSIISLAHYEQPVPIPRTWDALISTAKLLNADINKPFPGIEHTSSQAWSIVSDKIGDRGAATACIFAATVDLLRVFDVEPQRYFLQAAEDALSSDEFSLDRACSALLAELRWLRHPAPPRAPDHLPRLKTIHAALKLVEPEWSPLSDDAGWVGIYYKARHNLSIDHRISSDTWTRLRDAFGHHGAAVAVIIAAAQVSTGRTTGCDSVFRQLLDLHKASSLSLDRAIADLPFPDPPQTQNGTGQ